MQYTVISMFTIDTPYEKEIKFLEESLIEHNIPYKFYPILNTGDWTKNTQQKATVILNALMELKQDILWLDADAIVNKPLDFFNNITDDFDVCCHFLTTHYNPRELLTGTIYFKNNEICHRLVNEWIENNKTDIDWDQRVLQKLVDVKYKDSLRIKHLPIEYIKIKPSKIDINTLKDNYIVHKQLSRSTRLQMKNFQKSVQLEEIKSYLENKSIILVGNSANLLKKESGDFIDDHECVIRFNHGITSNEYEKYIGKETDIWVCAYNDTNKHLLEYNKFLKKPIYICRFNNTEYNKQLISKMFIWNMHYLQFVRKELNTPSDKNPSTGFTTIWFLKNVVGLKKIKIIGFDGMQSTNFYMKKPNVDTNGHEGKKEFEILKKYESEGWLEIL